MIFVESTGYPSPVSTHDANYDLFESGRFKGDIGLQPIVNVSWYDVNRYIKWKSAISGATYKLPTEERWEKTARGTDGRVFPWGNSLPDETIANYGKNWNDFEKKYITIKRVDDFEKGASPYGVLNMAGNVWEWTSSTYKTFFYNDPTIAIESDEVIKNELKVIRGGSWINKAHELRSTFRNRTWPYIKYNGIGFRVVRNKEK
jgi:formylglycine-generating enzyme required for sulfatase activity